MKILILLLFAALGFSQTVVQLRQQNNRQCRIVTPGASNTTPISITCAAAHNFAVGDVIRIANVAGNLAANGLRKVKATPTSTTFTITDTSDVDVAGSGAWSNGDSNPFVWSGGVQVAGKVADYTLTAHPRFMLGENTNLIHFAAAVHNGKLTSIVDSGNTATATFTSAHGYAVGNKICVYSASDADLNCPTASTSTSAFFTVATVPTSTTITWTTANVTDGTYNNSDLTVSGQAHGGNPAWISVQTSRAAVEAATAFPMFDFRLEEAARFALAWYINRADTAALTVAKASLNKADTSFQSGFCIDTTSNCGVPESDYIGFYLWSAAKAYTAIRSEMTTGERSTFAAKMLNGAFTRDCTMPTRTNLTGTVSSSGVSVRANGTMNGTGTSFLSQLAVGDMIRDQSTSYDGTEAKYAYVVSIASDTSATVSGGWNPSGAVSKIPAWTTGRCGAVAFMNHHVGSPLAHPLYFPTAGGNTTTGSGVSNISNMVVQKGLSKMAIGAVLADESADAIRMLSENSVYFFDYTWPWLAAYWTGFTSGGGNYHPARMTRAVPMTVSLFRNSFVSGPDLTGAPFLDYFGTGHRFMWAPGSNASRLNLIVPWGGDAAINMFDLGSGRATGFIAASYLDPTHAESGKAMHWYNNVRSMPVPNPLYAAEMFLMTDTRIAPVDYTSGPTQFIFRDVDLTPCATQGSLSCPPSGSTGYSRVISRTGWSNTAYPSNTDTAIDIDGGGFIGDKSASRAGEYSINVGGDLLMASDNFNAANAGAVGAYNTDYETRNIFHIPGLNRNRGIYVDLYGASSIEHHVSATPRWAGHPNREGRTSSDYMAVSLDLAPMWSAQGSAVSRNERHIIHHKASGEQQYLFIYDLLDTSSGRELNTYHHYVNSGNAGEGSTACGGGGCATVASANAAGTKTIDTAFLSPITMHYTSTYSSPLGGPATTFRVRACPGSGSCSSSATSLENLTIHRIGTSAAAVSPTALNPNSSWTGATMAGATVMFLRGTTLATSVPAVTTAGTTRYTASGLAAGTYDVRLGGTVVCNDVAVVTGDNTLTCASIGAGAIDVVQDGAPPSPPTISSTSPLPGGTAGTPYTFTFTASVTGAATWDTTSGSFAACGLTLASNGVLSGATPTAGTCAATVRVTDTVGSASGSFSVTIAPGGGGGSATGTIMRGGTLRGGRLK